MKKLLVFLSFLLTTSLFAGQVFYVVSGGAGKKDGMSWANAFSDVQTAIDRAYEVATADNPSEVWIAKGTYKHGSQMTMKNNVAIYGGFAGTETSKDQRVSGDNTILDGEGKYRVFYNYYSSSNPLTNSAKLDNVTIQNGYASDGYSNTFSSAEDGAGMYNNYASPEITNCTFSGNIAGDSGGGMCIYSSSPVLTNCTFANNSASFGGGMYNYSSSPTLTNCTFVNNSASGSWNSYGGGMYNEYESCPVIKNCILWGNTASSSGNEIYNYDSNSKPTIDTCIIKGGYSGYYGTYTNIITADPKLMPLSNYGGSVQTCLVGVGSSAIGAGKVVEGLTTDARGMSRSSTPTIGACEYQNKLTVGKITTTEGYLKYSSSYEFTLNVYVSDIGGTFTYQWYKNGVAISGATSSSYKTSQSAGTSKYTVQVSDGTTTITSSEITIETINPIYVSTTGSSENDGLSWTTAKNDIQEAIDLASKYYGSEVWIAKGTYKHGSAMTMKNGVAIYGGFAGTETSKDQRVAGNNTILDGEGKYRVFYNNYTEANPLTNSAKLDNVTIQNGNSYDGAGMYNEYASPEITNCTFSNNSASGNDSSGGGMSNRYSSPTLTNCTFASNSAGYFGGGMYNYYSSPTLTNCTFESNSASNGGGMYNFYSSRPTLTNCTFANNSAKYEGGGMDNFSSSPTLTNCTFESNSASNGGGMYNSSSSPTLMNCTFSNNRAEYNGGGMDNFSSSPTFTNCTFANNSASGSSYSYGGGMYNGSSSPVLTNCILWGNTASYRGNEIYNYDSNSKPTIDTCIIKGGKSGIYDSSYCTYKGSLITTDPKLMPLGNYGGNVQTCPVAEGSSAIGAGKVVSGLTTDARGFARSITTPTIGACEYVPTKITSKLKDTSAWANKDVILEIKASGENPTYQWQYSTDGSTWVDLDGETSSILTLSNVQFTQNGYQYRCVVDSDSSDLTYSNVAILTIKPIATINTQPTGFEVYLNSDKNLSVSASGEELSYQWYFNGKVIEGATNETLDLKNIQTSNSGLYYCVVSNPAGSVQSSIAEVIVRETASITIPPQKTESYTGYYTTLSVSASGYEVKYQWQKLVNGKWVDIVGATASTLDMSGLKLTDSGEYRCVVSNGGGSVVSETSKLTILKTSKIKITQQPVAIPTAVDDDTKLSVSASGGGIYYQWQVKNGKVWEDISGATSSTLAFKNLQAEDNNKEYRCILKNDISTATSKTAKLVV
ncbi:MAG: hypothetical protein E7035_04560, partial [Verrucomicrobiaceae bacterium]|nr:hypothetical protein [Verrucomicrobiaceae bacterium]